MGRVFAHHYGYGVSVVDDSWDHYISVDGFSYSTQEIKHWEFSKLESLQAIKQHIEQVILECDYRFDGVGCA